MPKKIKVEISEYDTESESYESMQEIRIIKKECLLMKINVFEDGIMIEKPNNYFIPFKDK